MINTACVKCEYGVIMATSCDSMWDAVHTFGMVFDVSTVGECVGRIYGDWRVVFYFVELTRRSLLEEYLMIS